MKGRVVIRRIGEETLLVPVRGVASGHCVYPVNATAAVAWRALEAGHTAAEAVEMMITEFDVAAEIAHKDIEACAAAWVEEGLLEYASG